MIGFAAVNTGNNLLFIILSFLLSIMTLSGITSIYNLKNIDFFLLPTDDIFAMTPAVLKFEVKSKYPFPSLLIKLRIKNSEAILIYVKNKVLIDLKIIFANRGKIKIDEIEISSYFPFYFFNRILKVPVNYEFVVFPKPIKCDFSTVLSDGKTKNETNYTKGKAFEGEITGVRGYNPDDPMKYIHWKASAKTTELMTKEFSPYRGSPVIIKLSNFSGTLEQKIGMATYSIIQLSKQGIPVGLELEDRFYKPDLGQAHIRKLLYALAFY